VLRDSGARSSGAGGKVEHAHSLAGRDGFRGGNAPQAIIAGVGLLAVAVLIANNTRDIVTDKLVGKRTLSVRIGDRASRILFAVCVLVPFAAPAIYLAPYPLMVFTLLALVGAIPAAIIMLWARSAREMVLALAITSLTALAYGVLMGVAFAF
jgi:1,4-dihydroxy-2-naphthoate octaprenyltransferase